MKQIDYYIIKKFLGTFFFAILLLIFIVIVFDISENIDEFLEKGAPLKAIIFDYYVNFIPYFVNLFSYLFTFISVIYFTSKMASQSEIVAILSSGVSYYRMLRPYFISAVILALLSFYLANFLIPHTSQNRRIFKNRYITDMKMDKDRNMHFQINPGTYVYLEYFNIKNQTGYKFTLEKFKDNELYYKMIADRIEWDTVTEHWKIFQYHTRTIDGMKEQLQSGTLLDTTFNLKPTDLYIVKERYEEMDLIELSAYIRNEKIKGSEDVVFYDVEKHSRIASPFATLVLTLIGVTLSSRKIRGGIGMHLGLGILLTFSFILLMKVSAVFGTYGNLSPAMAAWIPNIIYSIIGLFLLKTTPK